MNDALVDSNMLIAIWDKSDSLKTNAEGILKKFSENEIRFFFITNYVLVEVISFLIKKLRFELVLEAYNYLVRNERVKIAYVDPLMDEEIRNLFFKYKSLTLTDCSLIALSRLTAIKTLYSFDKGFDKVKEIIRLES